MVAEAPPGRFDPDEPDPELPHGYVGEGVLHVIQKVQDIDGPTAAEPMRGLHHLPQVALIGRDRMLELASTPVEYLWQDIAVAGTVVLIAGPPSEGKTTLMFLILAVRLGDVPLKLLERQMLPSVAGKYVVLIEGEHSESSTMRKMVKSLKIMGVDDKGLTRLIVIARKAVVVGSPAWSDIETLIARGLVSDIGIDTLARVAPAEANDESQQVAIFNRLAGAIERAPEGADRPTIWAVSHTRKNGAEKAGLAEVSGSVQRVGQADTVLLVRGEKIDGQTVSSRVTFEKLREDPDDYPKPAEFRIIKGLDGEPMLANQPPKRDDRPLEDRALDLMRIEARTKTWLGKQLCRSNADIEAIITNLFDSRSITSVKVQVGGRERTAFIAKASRAPDEASDPPWYQTSIGRASDEND